MNIKKNLPLIVALAIPLVLTLVIAASIYLPGAGKTPQYDFVYAQTNYRESGSGITYEIRNGKIVEIKPQNVTIPDVKIDPADANSTIDPMVYGPSQHLYLYDVETNTTKLLTITDTVNMTVDPARQSPDGYSVEYGSNGGAFPFFDNYSNNQYLIGNNRRIKTSISGYDNYFLGWVISQ